MEAREAAKILLKVTLNWPRQPSDELISAEWAEALAPVEFGDALRAVREYRDQALHDPPTVGEIGARARGIAAGRPGPRLLDEPRPTPEQRERIMQTLRQMVAELGAKYTPRGRPMATPELQEQFVQRVRRQLGLGPKPSRLSDTMEQMERRVRDAEAR